MQNRAHEAVGPAPGSRSGVHPAQPRLQPQLHLGKMSPSQDGVGEGGGLENDCLVLASQTPGSESGVSNSSFYISYENAQG